MLNCPLDVKKATWRHGIHNKCPKLNSSDEKYNVYSIKNMDKINSRLDIEEEKIIEYENIAIETIQQKKKDGKRMKIVNDIGQLQET